MALTKIPQAVYEGSPPIVGYTPNPPDATVLMNEIIGGQLDQFIFAPGSVGAPSMAFLGSLSSGWWLTAANSPGLSINGIDAVRWNANGNMIGGASGTAITGAGQGKIILKGLGTAAAANDLNLMQFTANATGPILLMGKARGATVDTYTIAQSADQLGVILFKGADGATTIASAQIVGTVRGTPAVGDVRASLDFWVGTAAGVMTNTFRMNVDQSVTVIGTGALGYGPGSGGAVAQLVSRTTGVTLNAPDGVITMFSGVGSATPASFTVTCSAIGVNDGVLITEQIGSTNIYLFNRAVAAGSFKVTFWTTGGTAVDAPVLNYQIIKGSNT